MEIEGEISMMLDLNWFIENKQLISLETVFAIHFNHHARRGKKFKKPAKLQSVFFSAKIFEAMLGQNSDRVQCLIFG